MVYLYKEYYSVIKKDKTLTHATAWIILKNIVLNKRTQSQKTIYIMILLHVVVRRGKFKDTESRWAVALGRVRMGGVRG